MKKFPCGFAGVYPLLLTVLIAPEANSYTNPIVKIIRKNSTIKKPRASISYMIEAAGKTIAISRSNIKNNRATI